MRAGGRDHPCIPYHVTCDRGGTIGLWIRGWQLDRRRERRRPPTCPERGGQAVSGRQPPSHTFVDSRSAGVGRRHGRRSADGRRATRAPRSPGSRTSRSPSLARSTVLEMTQPQVRGPRLGSD